MRTIKIVQSMNENYKIVQDPHISDSLPVA